jgi:phosphate transport system protein
MDVAVDELQQKIEEKVVATIALRQPMAIDLRALIAMLRITNDLERIGDLAKNVGKRGIAITGERARPALIRSLKRMTTLVVSQLAAVLESFTERDATKALRVWERDRDIDDMHDALFRELLTYAMEDAGIISTCVQLLFCAKNIERMGDHATNIAEAVHYMVNGYPFADERPKSTH